MIPPIPITQLVQQCVPGAPVHSMAAIIKVESSGNPLTLFDNTTGRSILPSNKQEAKQILKNLIAKHHQVDVGIAQVDTANFAKTGLTVDNAFDACSNIRAGNQIFMQSYTQAVSAGFSGQSAVFHAFEAYNSGRVVGDASYANRVLRAAGIPVFYAQNEVKPQFLQVTYASWAQNWSPDNQQKQLVTQNSRYAQKWNPTN